MQKVVLITGASAGLGESIANYLAEKQYIVYGTSRKIEGQTRSFRTLNMDVNDKQNVQAAVEHIIQEHARIDVLVNNAGLGIASPIETVAIEDVTTVLNTNVIGVVRTIQAVLPYMRQQKDGLIINISSIGSETGLPYRGIYSASKAAVDRITEALRIELSPYNIKACYVQPGGINTDINKNRIRPLLEEENVYKANFEKAYKLIDESVSQGLAPEIFGELIEKIILSGKVKRCYRVGKPVEKLSVLLKRILPVTLYENLIKKHYDM